MFEKYDEFKCYGTAMISLRYEIPGFWLLPPIYIYILLQQYCKSHIAALHKVLY